MTQEERQLLFVALCGYLPYGVQVKSSRRRCVITLSLDVMTDFHIGCSIKPYLRPMSSMTEEEKVQLSQYACIGEDLNGEFIDEVQRKDCAAYIDWLNKNHFDFRGLIEKNLAIEVTEENNPYIDISN